jgi:predicted nucleotidyltransferase component of viral defense system
MKLHTNKKLFKEAIVATAQKQGIKEIFIEKDYWVTLLLKAVFENEIGKETVFKGGTALSKCNSLIKRFSEDIDFVVLRKPEESNNQLKKKLKAISKCVEKIVPEIEVEGITNKKGMLRKTVHSYEKQFRGKFGQIKNFIVIESSWLGSYEPYEEGVVSSMIYKIMKESGQQELIDKYDMNPFKVNVLSTKRTICEKIMSLVRFSYSENPIEDLKNKIRHIYDIHILLKDQSINNFFNSVDFDKMLNKVGKDDIFSYKNDNQWLKEHPVSALIFIKPESTWAQLRNTYNHSFKELVYGEFPTDNEILETIKIISKRLRDISWKIK